MTIRSPPEVRQVLEAKCGDCHSESTHWPLYSRLAPASWLVEHDVSEAREHFNMSRWGECTRQSQVDLLTRIGAEARSGQMPLKHYLLLHPGAKLTGEDQQMIYEWTRKKETIFTRIEHTSESVAGSLVSVFVSLSLSGSVRLS